MEYAHIYKVSPKFNAKAFAKVADDFVKMVEPLRVLGVVLANVNGIKYPTISPTEISFNGWTHCGHGENEQAIKWPTERKEGIGANIVAKELYEIGKGESFVKPTPESRTCGGNCNGYLFSLEREMTDLSDHQLVDLKAGRKIHCHTITSFKPYDLAVNIVLIIAKHYLGDAINITTTSESEDWDEARRLCRHFLGYSELYEFDGEEE